MSWAVMAVPLVLVVKPTGGSLVRPPGAPLSKRNSPSYFYTLDCFLALLSFGLLYVPSSPVHTVSHKIRLAPVNCFPGCLARP